MDFRIPEPLTLEHQSLHRDLRTALEAGGAVAEAARAVVEVLHPHFVREEQIAMPPLALLGPLSRGEFTAAMRAELPRMLEEHASIKAALLRMKSAAEAAGRPDIAAFADSVVLHARTEEEVLYPASLLVGDWVRQRAASSA
jgi:iron-sulfur cluster repair protein YtfE (RIC family)